MTSVGAYLKKLLYQYDCVVVPELGGFLTHYQSASYSAATGQYVPPRRRLAFNEALRLDDGMLVNYLMLHEELTREEAFRKISQFVTTLRQQVQQAGSFTIDGIGLFSLNDEGSLQFDPELRHNFFGEAFGMAPIAANRLGAVSEEAVEAVTIMALGPVMTEEVVEQIPFTVVHRAERTYVRWVAAAVVVGALGALSYFSVIQPGQPLQSSFNPATIFQLPSALTETWNRLTKSSQAVPSATAIHKPTLTEPQHLPMMTVPQAPSAPTAPVEATPVTETVKPVEKLEAAKLEAMLAPVVAKSSKEPEKKEKTVNDEPVKASKAERNDDELGRLQVGMERPYFIVIAGSFANRPNAIRFRRTLKKAGYDDAYIITPDKTSRLYKVAAVGYPQKTEAVASTDSLSKLTGIPAWVMRY